MRMFRSPDGAWRGLTLALLVCALAARMLVPDGWMAASGAQGMRMMLCTGQGRVEVVMPVAGDHKAPAHHQQGEQHPCAFAGLGLAAGAEQPPVVLSQPRAEASSPLAVALVSIGRGLAAPPPFSTGPPATA